MVQHCCVPCCQATRRPGGRVDGARRLRQKWGVAVFLSFDPPPRNAENSTGTCTLWTSHVVGSAASPAASATTKIAAVFLFSAKKVVHVNFETKKARTHPTKCACHGMRTCLGGGRCIRESSLFYLCVWLCRTCCFTVLRGAGTAAVLRKNSPTL